MPLKLPSARPRPQHRQRRGRRKHLHVPDPAQLRPTEHFAVESRIAAWHVDDGLPGSRLDANANVMQRWRKDYGDAVQPGLAALHQDTPPSTTKDTA
jgi:hypothetical protein